jgi:GTPase SAR1 family protein
VSDIPTLVTPPPEVARRGLAGIRAFFDELGSEDLVQRTFVRLMFVGYQSAGKSKLNFTLQGKGETYVDESTCGIETALWEPGKDWPAPSQGIGPITFSSSDFAGQKVYYAMHRFFLSERALYLFLVDLSDDRFESTIRENVSFWIASLNKHTKGAVVRVVGTKVDRIRVGDGAAVDAAEVERRRGQLFEQIRQDEKNVVEELRERVACAYEANAGFGEGARAALEARPTLPERPTNILLSSLPETPEQEATRPGDHGAYEGMREGRASDQKNGASQAALGELTASQTELAEVHIRGGWRLLQSLISSSLLFTRRNQSGLVVFDLHEVTSGPKHFKPIGDTEAGLCLKE